MQIFRLLLNFLLPTMLYILDEPPAGGGGGKEDPPPAAPELPEWAKDVEFPEGLEEDLKKSDSISIFVKDKKIDYANVLKSYVNAQKLVGKDKAVIPTEKSTDDEWNAFYDKLGRPALDKYDMKIKNADKVDKDFQKEFKEHAHTLGLLPKQAEKMFDWYFDKIESKNEEIRNHHKGEFEAEMHKLKEDWGIGFDKEIDLAKRALRQFLEDDDIQDLKKRGMTADVGFIRLMNKIGKGMKEDTFKHDSVATFGITKDEAEQKIGAMFSDPNGPYLNTQHANHAKAVSEMLKLQEIIAS